VSNQPTSARVTLIGEGLTKLADIPCNSIKRICVVIVVATTALDQFVISMRPNDSQDFIVIRNAGSQFTTEVLPLVEASGDLTALGAGATGYFIMDVAGFDAIRIEVARASGDDALIILEAGGL